MTRSTATSFALLPLAAGILLSGPAPAQLISNDAWSPPPQNRASIAFSMKAIEDGTGAGGSGAAGSTSILCGGGGASATANNTCIILNNSDGNISTDQASDGDQDATTSSDSTQNIGTQNVAATGAEEIMDVLGIE